MEKTKLNAAISPKKLQQILDVSPMTIYLWRKRSVDPLPCRTVPTDGGRHRVYFPVIEVGEWLLRNKMQLLKRLTERRQYDELNDGRHPGSISARPERLSA